VKRRPFSAETTGGSQSRRYTMLLLALLLLAAPAFACGPFFPNTVLDQPEGTLRAAPVADFASEIRRFTPDAVDGLRSVTNEVSEPPPADATGYQDGADLWHAGKTNEARLAWQRYLQLPATQRLSRSTWAAYMIGKSYLTVDPSKSVPWFERTRALARRGFTDDIGLAASSLGWEAQAELRQEHYERAAELYLQHFASGDEGALISLRVVAHRALLADPQNLLRYARCSPLNRVMTAYLVSGRGNESAGRAWLVAVENGNVINLTGADRLAWLAYQTGDFTCAARWLKRAANTSPAAQWVRAKLLLRGGKMEEATALFAQLVHHFPTTNTEHAYRTGEGWWEEHTMPQQIASELAILSMGRGQYVDALDLLLRHDYWTDAAYVAERVLTVDELARYASTGTNTNLQYLLGRRYARLGQYDKARPLLPEDLRSPLDELVAAQAKREAATLWQAARTLRRHGMELTGTELEPDWFIHGGSYDSGFASSNRLANATDDEQQRATHHAQEISPLTRFHYRLRAADLAWEAATLMPDNTDETARVLHEAGTWLKDRDPQAADRFYKALVNRCGQTALGKAADKRRWF
jgi:tetratricopeptide (TPR) repeat protein